jgi:hypothetical protein
LPYEGIPGETIRDRGVDGMLRFVWASEDVRALSGLVS